MSEKFTKEIPWKFTYNHCQHYGDGEITDANGNLLAIVSGSNYSVCFGGPNRDWEGDFDDGKEHEANASLMASAPELYADLKTAAAQLRKYEELHRAKGTEDSLAKAEVNAELASRFEATLAKARGEV